MWRLFPFGAIMSRIVLFLLPVSLLAQSTLYEEDLQKARPYREEGYRQLLKFADSQSPFVSLLQQFKQKIGYPPVGFLDKPTSRCEIAAEDHIAIYSRCWITVAPGLETYGLYLVPKNLKGPAPLVVSLHGGGGFPEMALFKGGTNYHDQIRGAVAHGYVVWAPQFVMYPFRDRDTATPIPAEVRAELDAKFRNKGTSLMAIEAMKVIKSLDALLTRPEVDSKRVAMIGLSYGGFYSLYIAALDERIKAVVASCSFREAPMMRESIIEGRPLDLTSPQQIALVAPRALQVQAGLTDASAPIESVRRAIAEAKTYYQRAGKLEMLDYQEFQGGHEWRGDIAWQFLSKYL